MGASATGESDVWERQVRVSSRTSPHIRTYAGTDVSERLIPWARRPAQHERGGAEPGSLARLGGTAPAWLAGSLPGKSDELRSQGERGDSPEVRATSPVLAAISRLCEFPPALATERLRHGGLLGGPELVQHADVIEAEVEEMNAALPWTVEARDV